MTRRTCPSLVPETQQADIYASSYREWVPLSWVLCVQALCQQMHKQLYLPGGACLSPFFNQATCVCIRLPCAQVLENRLFSEGLHVLGAPPTK